VRILTAFPWKSTPFKLFSKVLNQRE
jgi:hypothetical protein